MAMTRTTPTNLATRAVRETATPAPDPGARFEAPLYTVPYPVCDCHGASLDTRDLDLEDGILYRSA